MFKVGDEVQIKGKVVAVDIERSGFPYWVGAPHGMGYWLSEADITDKTYEKGLADAWELAKKLFAEYKDSELDEIFGKEWSFPKLMEFTYEEALAKIEAYEKEKYVCVGDVVECNGFKGVVLHIFHSGSLNIVYENGIIDTLASVQECEKTGNHIDIESLLKQIGE